jgi:hypothetical protein
MFFFVAMCRYLKTMNGSINDTLAYATSAGY